MRPNIGEWNLQKCAGEMNIWLHAFKDILHPTEASELGFDLSASGDSLAKNLEQICEFRPRGLSDSWVLNSLKEAMNLNDEIQAGLLEARQANVGDAEILDKAEALCKELSGNLDRSIQSLEGIN
jgi:hypothetical protein